MTDFFQVRLFPLLLEPPHGLWGRKAAIRVGNLHPEALALDFFHIGPLLSFACCLFPVPLLCWGQGVRKCPKISKFYLACCKSLWICFWSSIYCANWQQIGNINSPRLLLTMSWEKDILSGKGLRPSGYSISFSTKCMMALMSCKEAVIRTMYEILGSLLPFFFFLLIGFSSFLCYC